MTEKATLDPRTRMLLEAPILGILLRLGAPNAVVMLAQASVGLIETHFVGNLGTAPLAGMALVFPVVMLMQMMSAGAVGGGISSAIARALGAQRRTDANALVLHSLLLAVAFGLIFTAAAIGAGPWLYGEMGGAGPTLDAALQYSNLVFAGAIFVWLFNSLAAVIRGTGNMTVPAVVTCGGVVALIPLSRVLIFGWGSFHGMGIAGGALALLAYYAVGSAVLAWYIWSPASLLRPTLRGMRLRWQLFSDILRVGLAGAVSTAATNLAIGITTALVGTFGTAAIAGYGTASRLEYLLVPVVFGFGGPLVAIVGTCIGAGLRERALHATWIGAGMAAAIAEVIGLAAAAFPRPWMALFNSDPAMLDAGAQYLRLVGPVYGFFGLGLALYFASQGAGRLLWPVAANGARLAVAAIGGWLALRLGGTLAHIFAVQALALLLYGALNAFFVAGGSWFGPIRWPRRTAELVRSLPSP
jgi:putative MATE family efflux protein